MRQISLINKAALFYPQVILWCYHKEKVVNNKEVAQSRFKHNEYIEREEVVEEGCWL